MASLPAQHPSLAIHMTDRATTPLISSSQPSTNPSLPSQRQQQPQSKQHRKRQQQTAFSTSPPSSSASASSSSSPPSDDHDGDKDNNDDSPPSSPASRQATALTTLSATALLSYDAAKRLGRGAPLRTMVEHGGGGPVVLHSYMCPMGLALGVPGRNLSSASLSTAVGGAVAGSVDGGGDDDGLDGGGGGGGGGDDAGGGGVGSGPDAGGGRAEGGGRPHSNNKSGSSRAPGPLSFSLDPVGGGDDGDGGGADAEGIDPSDPPMLTSTVVAPRAEDLREARRAAARLEKVARVFQAEWVSTGRR